MEQQSDVSMAHSFKRKENWSTAEVDSLVQAVADNKDLLSAKLSMSVTAERKGRCWDAVTSRVNSVSLNKRTLKEVKKKWQTYQSNIKSKEAKRMRETGTTGGGPMPVDLTCSEKAALSVIPKSMLLGISCGIDSAIGSDKQSCNIPNEEGHVEIVTASGSASEPCNVEIVTDKGDAVDKSTEKKKRKVSTVTSCDNGDDYQAKLIKIEERRLEIEEERLILQKEQTVAIKEIAGYLRHAQIQSLQSLLDC